MATHNVTKTVQSPTGVLSYTSAYTGTGVVAVENESVSTGQTDFQINVAIDFSALKSFYLVSDKAVTVETNSGSAADDTFNLVANVPLEWQSDSYYACPITADITALFVTNASGATATINLVALVDATP